MKILNKNQIKYKAFTLAEILLTLTIIGVVAAATIPSLINSTKNTEFKVAYKKAFLNATDALKMANLNHEISYSPDWHDMASKKANFNAIKSKFNVIKDCSSNNNKDCWPSEGELFWGGNYPTDDAHAFIDNSGMVWSLLNNVGNGVGSELIVDVNGAKGPNKMGRDRYVFTPRPIPGTPQKLMPYFDCISETDCGGQSPAGAAIICADFPCYYTSWLIGTK